MYKISGILYRHNNQFWIDWQIEETLPTLCSKLKYVAHFCIKHGSNLAPKLKKIISISYVCTKNFMRSLFRRKIILTRSLPQRFGVIYAVSCYKLSVCLCQKKNLWTVTWVMEWWLLNRSFENSLSCTVIMESPVLLSFMLLRNACYFVVLFSFSSCSKPEMYHCLKMCW